MKNFLFLLTGAALTLASCSQTSSTDTATTTTPDGMATTTTTTTTTTYETRGARMAERFANDMKITDEATKNKIRTAYVNRSRRYSEMREKYKTDTAGMAAAMRQYYTDTDAEFKTILTDPAQYKAYESSARTTYDESTNLADDASNSMSATAEATPATTTTTEETTTTTTTNAGGTPVGGAMDNATKVKVKRDGDMKIKDADGNKLKVDGDDGTIKQKGNGEKTVVK